MPEPNFIDNLNAALPAAARQALGALPQPARPRSLPPAPAPPGDSAGTLIDPFHGETDLEAGLLRVLHAASFRDDATRILRGARYEARLGFRFEPQTLRWLRRDVRYLAKISGPRPPGR